MADVDLGATNYLNDPNFTAVAATLRRRLSRHEVTVVRGVRVGAGEISDTLNYTASRKRILEPSHL